VKITDLFVMQAVQLSINTSTSRINQTLHAYFSDLLSDCL